MSEIPYIADIAKVGLVGIMLALTLWRLYYTEKELRETNAARVADWKEIGDLAKGHTLSTANWVNANEVRTRAIEATVTAQEKIIGVIQGMIKSDEQLRTQADQLIESHQKMREALVSKGVAL